MSVAPPGGKGTMNFTGLVGQDCACAATEKSAAATKARTLFMTILLV
jgi:hypothetical protein